MNNLKTLLSELAISESEYAKIVSSLGREPNELELGMFGSAWSEHCGYKHSKSLLKHFSKLPANNVLVEHGSENAGAIDIGDNRAIVMKIESHNHPSAIEPIQGAATGIGGIVRDIFSMGARPIALLNSLRFGEASKLNSINLLKGVVNGISNYGNCIGVPNVGGEVYFSSPYNGNPLVNAMCVGVVDHNKIKRATMEPNSSIFLIGSETGRDGIHGASGLASKSLDENQELRSAVQVGNPFMEKILIEACLELALNEHVVGIQDLGAAGLATATIEAAENGKCGIYIELDKVPLRDSGMTPYEIMLSESQERMIIAVEPNYENIVIDTCKKWGISFSKIGRATNDGIARIEYNSSSVATIPTALLTNPPNYVFDTTKPSYIKDLQNFDFDPIELPSNPIDALKKLLSSPNIASKEHIYKQYDHQVQTNTLIPPGYDAAVLRIKGTNIKLALTTDGNGRYCYIDPKIGGAISVAEACRNLSTVGANPVAITDCLNFGNPEENDVYYQLEKCIEGIVDACTVFDIPVISGNVSLYNQTNEGNIYPTPIIGALGLIKDDTQAVSSDFKSAGDVVYLLGMSSLSTNIQALSGSEWSYINHQLVAGKLHIDLQMEKKVQSICRELIKMGIIQSSHDCSDGGIAVAISECCIKGSKGITVTCEIKERWDVALFGEEQSRILISVSPANEQQIIQQCKQQSIPILKVGYVSEKNISIGNLIETTVDEIRNYWEAGISQYNS